MTSLHCPHKTGTLRIVCSVSVKDVQHPKTQHSFISQFRLYFHSKCSSLCFSFLFYYCIYPKYSILFLFYLSSLFVCFYIVVHPRIHLLSFFPAFKQKPIPRLRSRREVRHSAPRCPETKSAVLAITQTCFVRSYPSGFKRNLVFRMCLNVSVSDLVTPGIRLQPPLPSPSEL